ncbi:MAG TPA: hypothetical protein DCP71_05545 [Verrucomicrobiales bacterium]|nr:hypothetical protein [Verrucomicrobiales bacterium]
MNYINLATLDSMYEAENLAEALSRNGITARTHDEQDVQRFIFFTKPKAFSIVQVHDADYARAVNLIQDMQGAHEPMCRHIFSCPECGSLAVEYPQFTRKYFITPLLLEWASNFGLSRRSSIAANVTRYGLTRQEPSCPRSVMQRECRWPRPIERDPFGG